MMMIHHCCCRPELELEMEPPRQTEVGHENGAGEKRERAEEKPRRAEESMERVGAKLAED